MSEKKPTALFEQSTVPVCPICGQSSYSPGGIHPQCAQVQADAPRKQRLQEERKAEAVKKAKQSSKDAAKKK